jgi:hypothetical protein
MISDHLPWQEEDKHFSHIEKKIGSYLRFIQSGQIAEVFPSANGFPVRIKLVCKYPPSSSAKFFLDAAGKQLAEMGMKCGGSPCARPVSQYFPV